MSWLEIILLSVGLGLDAFSVAIGVGVCWCGPKQIFRLCFHFGLFQFFMPLIGWVLGGAAASIVGPLARYLAAIILAVIAVRMLLAVFGKKDKESEYECDPTRGWSLIALSIATSIDALGAGFGLGLVASNLFFVCVVIGLTAAAMTFIGMRLAGKLSAVFGSRIEALGGIVLLFLSVKIAIGW